MKDIIDEQEREVERAVISRGKYVFREEFSNLKVSELKWFKMTKEQRQAPQESCLYKDFFFQGSCQSLIIICSSNHFTSGF